MLTDHKFRQKLYLIFSDPEIIKTEDIIFFPDISKSELVPQIINYFKYKQVKLIYPAKSYSVAIIYSLLLEKYFGCNFYNSLSDQDLFQNTDQYFVPYNKNKSVYDLALKQLFNEDLIPNLNTKLEQVQKTVESFSSEFFIKRDRIEEVVSDLPYDFTLTQ